jgi:phosphomethylpyrimidine synthase
MRISQDVRAYAREHGLTDRDAVEAAMEEKSAEFRAAGATVYVAPPTTRP